MSMFNLENDCKSTLKRSDLGAAAPMMRWQKKLHENSVNNSLSASLHQMNLSSQMSGGMKKSSSQSSISSGKENGSNKSSPSRSKSPGRSTPGRKGSSRVTSGDRLIPSRLGTDLESASSRFYEDPSRLTEDVDKAASPGRQQYQRMLTDNLKGQGSKILQFLDAKPSAGQSGSMKPLYLASANSVIKSAKSNRVIPENADKILDAPYLIDNYYLNVVDWGKNNLVAAALGAEVFIWNAGTGNITSLYRMEDTSNYISSVAWVKEGTFLAVGTSMDDVQIWDVAAEKRLRTMYSDESRVGCLSWNDHILSSGSRTGVINHHDVRIADHRIGTAPGHDQEICGLRWSPDGRYLASGGNDNLVNIWDTQYTMSGAEPIYAFNQHQAAVKALAWCPWKPHMLASGGGTADRRINFWNCNLGTHLKSTDTGSQVCALLWSEEHREIISGHGFPNHNLSIWKYPNMDKITDLKGHQNRVLQMCLSPDGQTVLSASADETLRMWNCFAVDPVKAKKPASKPTQLSGVLNRGIR